MMDRPSVVPGLVETVIVSREEVEAGGQDGGVGDATGVRSRGVGELCSSRIPGGGNRRQVCRILNVDCLGQ